MHEFDTWHLSKSLMMRFKLLERKYPDAFLWKSSINNHLWWSAQTCEGNGKLLVDKFISVLYHISNKHEWVEDGIRKQCQREKLTENEIKSKLWLNQDSDSYYALKKIIMSKDLLKDLEHAKNFVHTERLESYHNLRLKYMPKRIHLKYKGMNMRNMITILDHNHNINKKELGKKMVYSKPAGRYVLKTKYEPSNDEWRYTIMIEIKKN